MDNEERDMSPIFIKDLGLLYPKKDSKRKARYELYLCQYCNTEFKIQKGNMKYHKKKSCGCRTHIITHGKTNHPIFNIWRGMMRRCYNKSDKAYENYGGRGISVCKHWHSVDNFIEDMYPTFKKGLSIDRKEVEGDYTPDNCRWADRFTQNSNTQKIRSTNTSGFRGVTFDKSRNKYQAQIVVKHNRFFLGRYDIPERGALAYDTYVRKHNLEHTKNFSDEEYYKLLEKYKNV